MGDFEYYKGGATSNTSLIQVGREQIDTNGFIRSSNAIRVLKCTNATLVWETGAAKCLPDDKWTVLAAYTTATEETVCADTTEGATNKLERYLRWRIERSAAVDWEVCFWIRTTLK